MPSSVPPLSRRAFVAGACLGLAAGARAQGGYPSRPITIVVPYSPGGSNDTLARIIGREMSAALKQPVVIDNRPGASGDIGTSLVARAAPDGCTLLMTSSSMTTNAAIRASLPFDPVHSFAPITTVAQGPYIVGVSNEFPAHTMAELIALVKASPGKYNYASSGVGSSDHFAVELLKASVGHLHITHIPYRGTAPALADLAGNHTQMLLANGAGMLPMVRAARVRAIGITSLTRSAVAPDLSPVSSTVPGYEFDNWNGLLAPADTPQPVVECLLEVIHRALNDPKIKAAFLHEGAQVMPSTPAGFAARIASDIARWKRVAQQQGIAPDPIA